MSEYLINFDTLKFNLYEILNITHDASDHKIKKAYRNLILNFHPDKNNKAEEEVYYHIITANEILTNKDFRKKYDEYMNKQSEHHDDLKHNFDKVIKMKPSENKDTAQKSFNNKMLELNAKHNYNDENNSNNIKKKYEKIIKERETNVLIPKEMINDIADFNNKFEQKKNDKIFGDQLVPIDEDMKLSTYNINDNYTSLDIAFDNLYIGGGGITTSKFTSLDAAFKIQELDFNIENINVDSSIKKYKNDTDKFSDPTFQFSKQKYENW